MSVGVDNNSESYYLALLNDPPDRLHRGAVAARLIEDWIRANDIQPGESIGREQDIANRFGIGRSLAREAVRILERRGLGKPRPGPSGGFIVGTLSHETPGWAIADYFRLVGFRQRQLLDAREAVDMLAVRLAVEHPKTGNPTAGLFVHDSKPDDSLESELKAALAFRNQFACLGGNQAVILFVDALNELTLDLFRPESRNTQAASAFRRSEQRCQRAVIDAIEKTDADAAAAAMQKSSVAFARILNEQFHAGRADLSSVAPTAGTSPRSRASQVAQLLANDAAIALSVGKSRLGSEWDLCERHSVSRLVLRQAVRILEDGGVVESKRGRGRGLMIRAPHQAWVVRQVTSHLVRKGFDDVSPRKLLCLLNAAFPVLAASRANDDERAVVRDKIFHLRQADQIERLEYLHFLRHLTILADSPIVDLLSLCLVAYTARKHLTKCNRIPVAKITEHLDLCSEVFGQIDDTPNVVANLKVDASARMVGFGCRELS